MKLAVTYDQSTLVFQHFGHTPAFKIYTIENNEVISTEVVSTNGSGHGALAGLLAQLNVNTLICGGIGAGAQNALTNAGIQFYAGVKGFADEAVDAWLHGRLLYRSQATCDHHHHDENHVCGSGCGSSHCH